MEFCSRHRDRDAFSFCHSCGKYFCKECLTEGKEYYYCDNSECRKQLMLEKEGTANDAIQTVSDGAEKEFVRLDIELNQMDAAVLKSLMDNEGIDYYCSSGVFFDAPAEFYISADQINEVEEILKNFNINPVYYSTKNDLTD